MKATQLKMDLSALGNNYLYYLVPHSGINQQWNFLQQYLESIKNKDNYFQLFYLFGKSGVGKTYLINCFKELAKAKEVETYSFDFSKITNIDSEQDIIASFVKSYEEIKSSKGLVFVESISLPAVITTNPHLLSRLKTAELIELFYPQDNELVAFVSSLLERNNLKLKEKDINYLLQRSPSDPLSLSQISARIDSLILEQTLSSKRAVIKKALGISPSG